MSPEVISIIVLVLLFLIGTIRSVNMGILGFVAAFAVGTLAVGMPVERIGAGFPVDLFLSLLGLTFLFGFAQQNGSVDLLVQWGLRAVRGRVALAPWIFFALSGALMSIGAIFAIACVAPLAIPFARRYNINQLMMGMMVVHGGMAGAFSPISVYGVFVNSSLNRQGVPGDPLLMLLISLVFNTLIGAVVYLTMGGRKLLGLRLSTTEDRPGGAGDGLGESTHGASPAPGSVATARRAAEPLASRSESTSGWPTRYQLLTLAGLAALALGTTVFRIDIGVLSLSIAAVLAVIAPQEAKTSLSRVSWGAVVLVCGVVTYIEVLRTAGAVDLVSSGVAALGLPVLAALLLCYLCGIVSALASSLGTIGVALAVATPFLAAGDLHPVGFIAALAVSATVVDVSPFSTNGALVLANVDEESQDRYFRQMLLYAGVIVVAAPALAWLAVFLPL